MNAYQMMICPDDRKRAGYIGDVKTMEINANGEYSVRPDDGYQGLAGVDLSVKARYVVPNGMKFGNSSVLDMENMDFSRVTDMSRMFEYCFSLTSLDLSGLNTSQVTNMSYMFNGCSSLTSLDLSNFDTSKVLDMSYMFRMCRNLPSLDLSNFDTSQVTDMSGMFSGCTHLTTVKVINCNDATKQKILTQLQTDLRKYTWTLGDDGIIRRS